MGAYLISPRSIHLWLVKLPDFIADENYLLSLLSPDEIERAMHFRFPYHRKRFVTVRGLLRKTLSFYTGTAPKKITFTFGPHGKPYLSHNELDLQFNVSHSADLAVFALTSGQEIGVDIEKIKPHFNEKIAKRFFSQQEYAQLMALSLDEQIKGFYRIWSKREAVIKALGEGLLTSSPDFSVSLDQFKESIIVTDSQRHTSRYYVANFAVPDSYASAFAVASPIEHIEYKNAIFSTP